MTAHSCARSPKDLHFHTLRAARHPSRPTPTTHARTHSIHPAMRASPRKGLPALLLLLACALLPAVHSQTPPIPGGDPCSASSEPRCPLGRNTGGIPPPPPPPLARLRPTPTSPAACSAACAYKAIPEPTEPAKYDTGNAGAAILQSMAEAALEAGLESAGEAVGGPGGKLFSKREQAWACRLEAWRVLPHAQGRAQAMLPLLIPLMPHPRCSRPGTVQRTPDGRRGAAGHPGMEAVPDEEGPVHADRLPCL